MSIQNLYPAIAPTLNLSFALTKKLDPRITYSRASTATYYDGVTTAKAEENLLTYSQEFNNVIWVPTNGAVTANSTTAPDGTATAETITDDTVSGTHRISQLVTINANSTYVLSCFLKAGTSSYAYVTLSDTFTNQRYFCADFDLSGGTVRTSGAGTSGTLTSATITSVGNGWYRCVIIGQIAVVSTTIRAVIGASDGATAFNAFGLISYIGTGSDIYAWGAQLEQRSTATAYTATTTQPITNYIPVLLTAAAGVPRFEHNPTTGESLGLEIEEQRTNLLTYSEQFDNAAWTKSNATVTANSSVSPDGATTADTLVENTANSTHFLYLGVSVTSGTAYTFSFYAKAAGRSFANPSLTLGFPAGSSALFNLSAGTVTPGASATASITSAGNGWWRCSFTATANSTTTANAAIYLHNGTTASYTGNGYSGIFIWGAQLEAGAFPTSYIQTVASQVTRSADAASMTGTNFSSWYNQTQGTFYAQFVPASSSFGANKNLFLASDGTSNNYLGLRYTSSGSEPTFSVVVAGTAQAALSTGTMVSGTSYKLSGAYKNNDFAVSRNAGTVVTDTSGTIPVVTQAEIGMLAGISFGTQTIGKLAYYPLRVTNAQLQGLTS